MPTAKQPVQMAGSLDAENVAMSQAQQSGAVNTQPMPAPNQRGAGLLKQATLVRNSPSVSKDVLLPKPPESDLLTDEEVGQWLKVNKQWLSDHRTRIEPIIPHYRLGREIRYSRTEISAWLDSIREVRPTWQRGERRANNANKL